MILCVNNTSSVCKVGSLSYVVSSLGSDRSSLVMCNQLFARHASTSLSAFLDKRLRLQGDGVEKEFVAFAGEGNVLSIVANNRIDCDSSRFALEESFPWLVDDEGRPIDFTRHITVFEAVKYLSFFLNKRYGMDLDENSSYESIQLKLS
uniref:hypothetical protein n=1 Tax=Elmerina hispida TaxID=1245649 RepID=UPI003003A3FE|nr:hypothetical protein [Elmerina hispida]